MDKKGMRHECSQKKDGKSESRPKRFQPPRPNEDEDPGKDIWFMGF